MFYDSRIELNRGRKKLSLVLASPCSRIVKNVCSLKYLLCSLDNSFSQFSRFLLESLESFFLRFSWNFCVPPKQECSKQKLFTRVLDESSLFLHQSLLSRSTESWTLIRVIKFHASSKVLQTFFITRDSLSAWRSNFFWFSLTNQTTSFVSRIGNLLWRRQCTFSHFLYLPKLRLLKIFWPSQIQSRTISIADKKKIARDKRKVCFFMDYKQTFSLAYGVRAAKTFCVDTLINNTFNYSENALSNCQIIAKPRHKRRE